MVEGGREALHPATREGTTVISIKEEWEGQPSGLCAFGGSGAGWYHRLEERSVVLNVRLVQKRRLGFLEYNTRVVRAKVDTGSYHTIIDWGWFRDLGYRISGGDPVDLGLTGVVQNSDEPRTLRGWRERMSIYPDTGGKLRLAGWEADVIVANNVSERKFLIGLSFLREYPLILKDGLLVMMAQDQ